MASSPLTTAENWLNSADKHSADSQADKDNPEVTLVREEIPLTSDPEVSLVKEEITLKSDPHITGAGDQLACCFQMIL